MQKLWLDFFCRVFAEFDIAYLSVSVKQISSCMKFVFLFFALKPVGKFNNTAGVDKPSQVPRPTWDSPMYGFITPLFLLYIWNLLGRARHKGVATHHHTEL